MMIPLGTFRLEHDVPAGKSNGELFPTESNPNCETESHARPAINAGASRDLLWVDENVQLKSRVKPAN
jgi:hypothetical protein